MSEFESAIDLLLSCGLPIVILWGGVRIYRSKHPSRKIKTICNVCEEVKTGELRIVGTGSWREEIKPSQILAYECPNCQEIICDACAKKQIESSHLLGSDQNRVHVGLCPNCNNSFQAGPRKILLTTNSKQRQGPDENFLYLLPKDLEKHMEENERLICCFRVSEQFHYILTESRFISLDKTIAIKTISGVDVLSGSGLESGNYKLCLDVSSSSDSHDWRCFNIGANQTSLEQFAAMICKIAEIAFAPPVQLDETIKGVSIEFYTKINLTWPQKCSVCLSEDELALKTETIERGESAVGNLARTVLFGAVLGEVLKGPQTGEQKISYQIPRCPSCLEKKSVSLKKFDGVRVMAEFKNKQYAQEFIEINSKVPL